MNYNGRDSDDSTTDVQHDSTDLEASHSTDALLELLAHPHRQESLEYFVDAADETLTLDEVTTHLVSHERERTGDRPARNRVETMLHHVHLPALADMGVIEYDARSRKIRYRPHERLEALLACVRSVDSV